MNKQIIACLENPDKGSHIDGVLEHFTLVHPEDAITTIDIKKQIEAARCTLKEGASISISQPNYHTHLSIQSLGREKQKKEAAGNDKCLWNSARHMAEVLCAYEEDITLSAVSYSNGLGELDTRFVISSEADDKEPMVSMIRSVYGKVDTEIVDCIPEHSIRMYATGKVVFHAKKEGKKEKDFEKYQSWISGVLSALPSEGNYTVSLRFCPIQKSKQIESYRKKLNEQYRKLRFFADYNWGSTVNMGMSVNEGQHIGKSTIGMDSKNHNAGYSMNLGGRDIHKEALLLSDQMEHEISRMNNSQNAVLWAIEISVSAESMDTVQTLTSVLSGLLREADVQLQWSQKSVSSPLILNTKEMTPLMMFPTKEFCGFRFMENETFSLVSQSDNRQGFQIGNILWNGTPFSSFYLSPKALSRHAFICGMTGAGKTNTLFKIMEGIDLPFCVIEPVK